jgi:hypothetical protein
VDISIRVRSTDEGFAEAFRWHLAPFRRDRPDPDYEGVHLYVHPDHVEDTPPPYTYARGLEVRFEEPSLPTAFVRALTELQDHVSKTVRSFVALHAGAVATDEGALFLPAPTKRGKSTLVAGLLARGFRYLSDEAGLVDPVTSTAHPFPRRITLQEVAVARFPGLEDRLQDREGLRGHPFYRYARPEDLESETSQASTIRWLVFPGPDRSGSPRLSPIGRAEAVEQMAANCFNLHRYRDRGVIVLSRVTEHAEAFSLEGGTAANRAELLAERFLAA